MHTIKVKGQAVQKLQWKQTDGRTDATEFITYMYIANAVGDDRFYYLIDFTVALANSPEARPQIRYT